MAVEAKRGCGYRKAGGLYIVAGGVGEPCERLPIPIVTCPTCGNDSVTRPRNFAWVGADYLAKMDPKCKSKVDPPVQAIHTKDPSARMIDPAAHCKRCPVCDPLNNMGDAEPADQLGLMGVGEAHYPNPSDWSKEANLMGVSKRVGSLPKGLVIGKTWVVVTHPKAIKTKCPECKGAGTVAKEGTKKSGQKTLAGDCEKCKGDGNLYAPGIFHCFRPQAVELVVTPSMKKQAWVKKLVKQHAVKLVEVPENDPDHAPKAKKKSARARAMDKHGRKHAKKKDAKKEPVTA